MPGPTSIPAPAAAPTAPEPALRADELGELLAAFNDATARLHGAHEALRADVARLQGELREANEQLERSRRLAALGEMAAGIAHEVRNPLGSIRLYARMLEQDLAGRPEERRLAEKIGGAVRGMDAVVSDVLNFARELRVRPTAASAAALLAGAADEVLADESVAGADPGVLRVVYDTSASDELECDEQLVHRALVNVVRNAVQAMLAPEGGARAGGGTGRAALLTLSVRNDDPAGDAVVLAVRDTGPGIPAGALDRIFNPFFTTRATGTGLGLAIVHRIVDAHGGRIRVRNIAPANADGPPIGAEVELALPRSQSRPAGGDASCAVEETEPMERGPHIEVRAGRILGGPSRVTEDAA